MRTLPGPVELYSKINTGTPLTVDHGTIHFTYVQIKVLLEVGLKETSHALVYGHLPSQHG